MKDLTNQFGSLFLPVKALLIYRDNMNVKTDYYVESYDIDEQGNPVNAHPLSIKECSSLAKFLQSRERKMQAFLNPKGLLPPGVLFLRTGAEGCAIWHTPPQKVKLLFSEGIGIPSGEAFVPALIWKADRNRLYVFALTDEQVADATTLYHAPFFNVYRDGRVCMGNVQAIIPKNCCLEQFMALWQSFFYNSYFSHLIDGSSPVKGNIVQLWHELLSSGNSFPIDILISTNQILKSLIP